MISFPSLFIPRRSTVKPEPSSSPDNHPNETTAILRVFQSLLLLFYKVRQTSSLASSSAPIVHHPQPSPWARRNPLLTRKRRRPTTCCTARSAMWRAIMPRPPPTKKARRPCSSRVWYCGPRISQRIKSGQSHNNQAVVGSSTSSSTLAAWRAKLQAAGLLDVDHERYLKPISGTGTFLDGATGRAVALDST